MSTRLDLALHEIADAAGDASSLGGPAVGTTGATVRRLTGQVRRRRTARGAATAAVAAGVVGVIAVMGPRVVVEVPPGADPDAAPATCRSVVTTLPAGPDDVLDVALGYVDATGTIEVDAAPGSGLGTWQSGVADLRVAVAQLPPGTAAPSRLRLLVARDDVVVASTQEAIDPTSATTGEILRTRLGVADPTEAPPDHPVHALVPRDDVRWDVAETPDGAVRVAQHAALDLDACDGSGPLPAGTYDVWATTVDSLGDAHGSSGPWELTVVAAPDAASARELPEGFPRTVRPVDGRLVSAHRSGDGWRAEVATAGEDRVAVAVGLLDRVALRTDGPGTLADPPSGGPPWGTVVEIPGWSVAIVASQTPDGEPTVVYGLTRSS